jgi:hypothetical protein
VLGCLDAVAAFVAAQPEPPPAATTAVAVACQVRDQDVDTTAATPTLRRGVAKDRRISVEDPDMRHGRKSRSKLFDGYKRHVLRDLDTGLVRAVGITPANAPEAAVTDDIAADLHAQQATLRELHVDRAYLSSTLVHDRDENLMIFCKAWRVRNTSGRYAKTDFRLDFDCGELTCPNNVVIPFTPDKTVHFPKITCATCPLRAACTTSTNGRSISIHPDEALLTELRQRQMTYAAPPWSTTSTSSPANPTRQPPDRLLGRRSSRSLRAAQRPTSSTIGDRPRLRSDRSIFDLEKESERAGHHQ